MEKNTNGRSVKELYLLSTTHFSSPGEKPFQCNVCGKNFSQVTWHCILQCIVKYLFTFHVEPSQNTDYCSPFPFKSRLETYRHTCADTLERSRTSVSYAGRGRLTDMWVDKRLHWCIVKDRQWHALYLNRCLLHHSFAAAGDVQRHIVVHTGQKPHLCDICGRGR